MSDLGQTLRRGVAALGLLAAGTIGFVKVTADDGARLLNRQVRNLAAEEAVPESSVRETLGAISQRSGVAREDIAAEWLNRRAASAERPSTGALPREVPPNAQTREVAVSSACDLASGAIANGALPSKTQIARTVFQNALGLGLPDEVAEAITAELFAYFGEIEEPEDPAVELAQTFYCGLLDE